jgi:hypothetical protein
MGTRGGIFGYHAWEVRLGEVTLRMMMVSYSPITRQAEAYMQKSSRTLSILYGPLQWLQKLTLFSMLLTIFAPVNWTKVAVYTGIIVSGIMYIMNSIISGIYCGPRDGDDLVAYIKGIGSAACASPTGLVLKHGIATGAMSVLVDFYICLPLPSIWRLNLSTKKKVGVYLVFLAGVG